jgi:hypothetical protein
MTMTTSRSHIAALQIPSPPAVSDEDLTIALAMMDNSKYRIPMSVGPAHAETDNSACSWFSFSRQHASQTA